MLCQVVNAQRDADGITVRWQPIGSLDKFDVHVASAELGAFFKAIEFNGRTVELMVGHHAQVDATIRDGAVAVVGYKKF